MVTCSPRFRVIPWLMCIGLTVTGAAAADSIATTANGEALYAARCAACHDQPVGRTPPRIFLALLRMPEEIVAAMTSGLMQQQAAGLTDDEKRAIAVTITHKQFGSQVDPDLQANRCSERTGKLSLDEQQWNGWGKDLQNTAFNPAPGLSAADVPRLKLKWVFAHPGRAVMGRPVVAGEYLFVTSAVGQVFALNARSGCTYWNFTPGGKVRTAVVVGTIVVGGTTRQTVNFGDERGNAYALDASDGSLLWKTALDSHPQARTVGAPQFHAGRLYFPLTSQEEVAAADPKYPCCSFRGALVALDAASGKIVWKSYTIPAAPQPFKVNSAGTQMYGPAGAAIFSAPTIDAARGLVYVATGDSYTNVPTPYSDAVIAFDLRTGKRRWSQQVLANDAWLVGCDGAAVGNCPSPLGPDHDFASAIVQRTLSSGRQVLIAAAKSGIVYAFDPARRGKPLWQVGLGKGGEQGGVLWGPAADLQNVYVALSDIDLNDMNAGGGLTALRLDTGARVWHAAAPDPVCAPGLPYCSRAQVAAVTVIPGIAFAGGLDGRIRAYSTVDGTVVWEFATAQEFAAVNGATAHGGSIDAGGQVVANGVLYVNSGSTRQPGNALLAFTVDGK